MCLLKLVIYQLPELKLYWKLETLTRKLNRATGAVKEDTEKRRGTKGRKNN